MLKIYVYASLISEICVHGILQVNDISECSSELFPRRELGNRLRWTYKTPINPSQLRNLARSSICHSALHHKRGTPCDINLLTCFLNHFSYSFDSQANLNEPRLSFGSLRRRSPSHTEHFVEASMRLATRLRGIYFTIYAAPVVDIVLCLCLLGARNNIIMKSISRLWRDTFFNQDEIFLLPICCFSYFRARWTFAVPRASREIPRRNQRIRIWYLWAFYRHHDRRDEPVSHGFTFLALKPIASGDLTSCVERDHTVRRGQERQKS